MEKWKAAGIKVIPVVASVAYALKMQELGATAVVAEGAESGGHVGDNHTMALVPQIIDALDIPVLAAGGNLRWSRRCCGFHARCSRRAGGNPFPDCRRMSHP